MAGRAGAGNTARQLRGVWVAPGGWWMPDHARGDATRPCCKRKRPQGGQKSSMDGFDPSVTGKGTLTIIAKAVDIWEDWAGGYIDGRYGGSVTPMADDDRSFRHGDEPCGASGSGSSCSTFSTCCVSGYEVPTRAGRRRRGRDDAPEPANEGEGRVPKRAGARRSGWS